MLAAGGDLGERQAPRPGRPSTRARRVRVCCLPALHSAAARRARGMPPPAPASATRLWRRRPATLREGQPARPRRRHALGRRARPWLRATAAPSGSCACPHTWRLTMAGGSAATGVSRAIPVRWLFLYNAASDPRRPGDWHAHGLDALRRRRDMGRGSDPRPTARTFRPSQRSAAHRASSGRLVVWHSGTLAWLHCGHIGRMRLPGVARLFGRSGMPSAPSYTCSQLTTPAAISPACRRTL